LLTGDALRAQVTLPAVQIHANPRTGSKAACQ